MKDIPDTLTYEETLETLQKYVALLKSSNVVVAGGKNLAKIRLTGIETLVELARTYLTQPENDNAQYDCTRCKDGCTSGAGCGKTDGVQEALQRKAS
jgi:hydroxymethylpyrimidine/phosphomethylpyrimidine kinase